MIRIRPVLALAAAVTAAACDSSPSAPNVASVTVTPANATLPAIGATVQLSARAVDVTGNVVTGRTVEWSSSNAGVATVDASGLVRGVSVGAASITASVGGVSGAAAIEVEQCQETQTVDLSAGVYQGFESTECLIIPSGSNGDLYRVAVLRPTEEADASDVQTVTLRVAGLGVTQASEPMSVGSAAIASI